MFMTTEKIANGTIASATVTSYWWLSWLENVSDMAATILPILGVLWFLIQMVSHFRKSKK